MEPEGEVLNLSPFPGQVQFGCGKLLVTGQWHHLTVTVAKESKKSCVVSAYINGQMLGSAKVKVLCIDLVPDFCLAILFIFIFPCTNHNSSVLFWESQSMMIYVCNTCHCAGCEWSQKSRQNRVYLCCFLEVCSQLILMLWTSSPLPLQHVDNQGNLCGDAPVEWGISKLQVAQRYVAEIQLYP